MRSGAFAATDSHAITTKPPANYVPPPSLSNYTALSKSMIAMYNSTVGLIYESNEAGTSYGGHAYNKTYWINTDNELATWALWNNNHLSKSYRSYSAIINGTIQQYTKNYSLTAGNFYQVFWGVPLSTPQVLNNDNLIVKNSSSYIVNDEVHNSSVPLIYQDYANTLIIHCLNNYVRGNITGSFTDFKKAVSMWNGLGINDSAHNSTNGYSDYKIAVILFAAQVLNANITSNSNLSQMQEVLWRNFLPGVGVKTGYGPGHDNSTNTETNAFTLMAYNKALIRRVQSLQRVELKPQTEIKLRKGGHAEFNITYLLGGNQTIDLTAQNLPNGLVLPPIINFSAYDNATIPVSVFATRLAKIGITSVTLCMAGEHGWKATLKIRIDIVKRLIQDETLDVRFITLKFLHSLTMFYFHRGLMVV